jgi:hypothetical protein
MYLYRQIHQGVDKATARQDLVKIWTPNQVWQTYIDSRSVMPRARLRQRAASRSEKRLRQRQN